MFESTFLRKSSSRVVRIVTIIRTLTISQHTTLISVIEHEHKDRTALFTSISSVSYMFLIISWDYHSVFYEFYQK